MTTTIREKKYSEAEKLAKRKKAEADYIIGVVENYRVHLTKIFNPENKISGNELEELLYDKTLKTIETLREYRPAIGVILYKGTSEEFGKYILVQLGWLKLYDTNVPAPTKRGYELLDGLRRTRGQLPVEEANKKFIEKKFGWMSKLNAPSNIL